LHAEMVLVMELWFQKMLFRSEHAAVCLLTYRSYLQCRHSYVILFCIQILFILWKKLLYEFSHG